MLNNKKLEQVQKFTYLGSNLTEENRQIEDVKGRLSLARQKFWNLKKIWRDKQLSTKLKLRLFQALIVPIAIYGSECWTLTKLIEEKIKAFEMNSIRYIGKIHWTDKKTNDEVLATLQTDRTIINRITQAQRRYLGHVIRMPDNRLPKQAFETYGNGNRPREKPRYRWFDMIQKNMKMSTSKLLRSAKNKNTWRKAVYGMDATTAYGSSEAI